MIRSIRAIRWILLGLIALLGVAVIVAELIRVRPTPQGAPEANAGVVTLAAGASIGGPFHLIDDKGHPVTDATYRGRWMLVFFGYTNCPDECPLTLQKIADTLKELGPLADRLAPLFITVDPARDTTTRLASYLENFDSRIAGLTGSSEQIAAAASAYKVYYAPAEHEASGADIVSHSTFLYLMDPAGKPDAVFSQDIDADRLVAAVRARLSSQGRAQIWVG